MGLLKKVFKKVERSVKKAIPKEVRKAIPKEFRHGIENIIKNKVVPRDIREFGHIIDRATDPKEIFSSAIECFQNHQNGS